MFGYNATTEFSKTLIKTGVTTLEKIFKLNGQKAFAKVYVEPSILIATSAEFVRVIPFHYCVNIIVPNFYRKLRIYVILCREDVPQSVQDYYYIR